ncbi:Hsp20/alpha crystallin family protein [Chryseobacterium gossypii]|uniref:Hsp20/alpha crystallin family protein n=1 Tax=Chryseobacterium gossypii TaxID=3231602 RepID=UPI00352509A9
MSNLIRRNPYLLNSFFNTDLFDWSDKNFGKFEDTLPSVNVKETEDRYEIEVAAPGVNKEDFKIELHGNLLRISSESKTEHEDKDEKGNYTRREFNYRSFNRSFTLPDSVDDQNIEADYQNGILKIQIPKKENTRQSARQITIK